VTKRNARVQTGKLLMEILAMPENDRRELILVGHSIGAQIVVDILCELSRRNLKIHSVSLLGGALPADDPRVADCLSAIRFYCTIVYNPDDWVLKYLFPLDNSLRKPLGLHGWSGSDPRVFEARAHTDRFGFCNHFAYLYLEELGRLMCRIPPERPEIKVIQDQADTERIPADQIYWDTVDSLGGWKLQKNCFSGRFRILDDYGVRRAQGGEKKMQESFADVKRQLDGK
jgi:pimeloyl-ACP methyl ester carboxylesterase